METKVNLSNFTATFKQGVLLLRHVGSHRLFYSQLLVYRRRRTMITDRNGSLSLGNAGNVTVSLYPGMDSSVF